MSASWESGIFHGIAGMRCKLCGSEFSGFYAGSKFLREHEALCFGRAFNRHKEQDMGYPSDDTIEKAHERREPPTKGCGKHSCTDHERCRIAVKMCGCEECTAAMAAHPSKFAEIVANELAAAQALADKQDAQLATGLYPNKPPGEVVGLTEYLDVDGDPCIDMRGSIDPTTASIEAGNRERDELRRELAKARGENARVTAAILAALPPEEGADPPPAGLTGAANEMIRRLGRFAFGVVETAAEIKRLEGALEEEIKLHREACEHVRRVSHECSDLKRTVDLMIDAERRASAMWTEAHPDSSIMFLDDAKLFVWLLEQLDAVTREADELRKAKPRERFGDRETVVQAVQREHTAEIDRLKRDIASLVERREGDIKAIAKLDDDRKRLQSQVTIISKQRDEFDQQLRVTHDKLEGFMEATASLAVIRMRLEQAAEMARERFDSERNYAHRTAERMHALEESIKRKPREHLPSKASDLDTLIRAEARIRTIEETCWAALQAVPNDIGLPFFTERGPMDVEVAVDGFVDAAIEQVRSQIEQLRIADADRVPLRMDLDAAKADLKRATDCIDKCRAWSKSGGEDNGDYSVTEALDAYDLACAQASADPASDEMPF